MKETTTFQWEWAKKDLREIHGLDSFSCIALRKNGIYRVEQLLAADATFLSGKPGIGKGKRLHAILDIRRELFHMEDDAKREWLAAQQPPPGPFRRFLNLFRR